MKTTLSPYLNFEGRCAEAMKFYQSILGGELTMQTFGESGFAEPSEHKDKIVHAMLRSDDLTIMASDAPPGGSVTFGDSVHLSIVGPDTPRLTGYFNKLAEGGKIDMPLEKQFWGDAFGMLTDRFDIHWMVNIDSSGQE